VTVVVYADSYDERYIREEKKKENTGNVDPETQGKSSFFFTQRK
jgi:hypothetical protein